MTPLMLNECFARMADWVHIAEEALASEWPTFEAVRAFAVFQLKPRLAPAQIRKDLEKISTVFHETDRLPDLVRNLMEFEYSAGKRSDLLLFGGFLKN